jgi:hypothetical protein
MALEELVLRARPDIKWSDMKYSVENLEEDLYGKRGRNDVPIESDLEGYAGLVGGEEA